MPTLKNHELVEDVEFRQVRYDLRPVRDASGREVDILKNAWIWLDNPDQFNSYTTRMVKEVILAFRKASLDRAVSCIVFTAVGDRAFCTGGNVKEYAEYYAGRPQEYKQYMGLFNEMVTTILTVDKPVVCRVNGMRIGGGQEIGMACDFTLSSDMARYGQAGPRHGSAPDGGSTDFLHLFVGIEKAMESCSLCEPWSAHEALRLGLITDLRPVLKVDGGFVPNPLVVTDRWVDELGRIVYGRPKTGGELKAGKELLARGEIDLSSLDELVESFCSRLTLTMPNCLSKTIAGLRKKKLEHWYANSGTNRDWLALNMMTEAKAGFRAFNEGSKGDREVDFILLRQRLAEGESWDDEMFRAISPSRGRDVKS